MERNNQSTALVANYTDTGQENITADICNATPQALLSMNNLPHELKYELLIAAELYTLRMAYPVQARNFTEREVMRTNQLWAEVFAGIDLHLIHKAIIRFIATDRKAFFPSPGQIWGMVEEIIAEDEAERKRQAAERSMMEYAKHRQRVKNGENCSTCRFCEHRQVDGITTKLFCQNPHSYKYEGDFGYGTAATILCEFYEGV